jgi:hypothetical protein
MAADPVDGLDLRGRDLRERLADSELTFISKIEGIPMPVINHSIYERIANTVFGYGSLLFIVVMFIDALYFAEDIAFRLAAFANTLMLCTVVYVLTRISKAVTWARIRYLCFCSGLLLFNLPLPIEAHQIISLVTLVLFFLVPTVVLIIGFALREVLSPDIKNLQFVLFSILLLNVLHFGLKQILVSHFEDGNVRLAQMSQTMSRSTMDAVCRLAGAECFFREIVNVDPIRTRTNHVDRQEPIHLTDIGPLSVRTWIPDKDEKFLFEVASGSLFTDLWLRIRHVLLMIAVAVLFAYVLSFSFRSELQHLSSYLRRGRGTLSPKAVDGPG